MVKIAVLLTCFNRKAKTLSCLGTLYKVLKKYNDERGVESRLDLTVYLTDDGCTDGTSDAIRAEFPDKEIIILQGSGSLFWCGGMCFAWQRALESDIKWDYFLLLNDDVELMDNLFDELFATNDYCINHYKRGGLYSGITCSISDHSITTYGGNIWTNKFLGKSRRLIPVGKPQMCDTANANILLVSQKIVEEIGIFYGGYSHGCADYDYAILARKKDIPVLVTSAFCGCCDDDHDNLASNTENILKMNLEQRKKYFSNPLHSNVDYLKYIKRHFVIRYPFVFLGRILNIYFPRFYYYISNIRHRY